MDASSQGWVSRPMVLRRWFYRMDLILFRRSMLPMSAFRLKRWNLGRMRSMRLCGVLVGRISVSRLLLPCLFLFQPRCGYRQLKHREQVIQRRNENSHPDGDANEQSQDHTGFICSVAYSHIGRNDIRKLRESPGAKQESRFQDNQDARHAVPSEEQGGGSCQPDEHCGNDDRDSAGEHALPENRGLRW